MSRYEQLNQIIESVKPKIIVEIGTWNGDRAVQMVTEAFKHSDKVTYYGFDLFETASPETDARELNVKPHGKLDEVIGKLDALRKERPGFDYELIPGDTRETLAAARKGFKKLLDAGTKVDIAFIDGGHSLETIRSDWDHLKDVTRVAVFDDYYVPDEDGKCPDIEKFGCNKVLEGQNFTLMDAKDRVKDGGFVQFAVVGLNAQAKKFRVVTKNSIPDETIRENIAYFLSKNLRYIPELEKHGREAVMVSGGESFKHYLKTIRAKQEAGGKIVCVKHAHDYLLDRGIVPWGCILLDPRGHVKDFIENPHPDVNYFTASQCHPTTLDRLMERNARIWVYHAAVGAGEDKLVKSGFLIGGGSSSASRGVSLMETMGFHQYSFFGYDSCFWKEPDWDEKDDKGRDKFIALDVNGRRFWTEGQLVAQSQDFERIFKEKPYLDMTFYGAGMIPWLHACHKRRALAFEQIFDD